MPEQIVLGLAHMATTPNEELRAKEHALFLSEQRRVPHLFVRKPIIDSAPYLTHIGITEQNLVADKPLGHIKLLPEDFVVEEIDLFGTTHTTTLGTAHGQVLPGREGETWYAEVVKYNRATQDVQTTLAAQLGIQRNQIGYAGLKDKYALTCQEISIRGVRDGKNILAQQNDGFVIKSIRQGKGALTPGGLHGNQFTIVVRLPRTLTNDEQHALDERAAEITADGFWNFFAFQRFGAPRLLSHLVGIELLKGKYAEAVRMYVTTQHEREIPYFGALRAAAAEHWGAWENVAEILGYFPVKFQQELKLIEYLRTHADDYRGALATIPDQTKFFVIAYDSYCFNRKLSQCIETGEVPINLPIAIRAHDMHELYHNLRDTDGVPPSHTLATDFPFISWNTGTTNTVTPARIDALIVDGQYVTVSFALRKGAYATSLLMNLFTVVSDLPIVSGTPTQPYDGAARVGHTSLEHTLAQFEKEWSLVQGKINLALSE